MITISTQSDVSDLQERLVIAGDWFSSFAPVFDAIHDAWLSSRKRMFETSGASIGASWPMYSKATNELQYAAVKGDILGHRMTRRDLLRWRGGTERLYPSLAVGSDPNHVYRRNNVSMTTGTRVGYAANHDTGSGSMPKWAGGHAIPQRRLFKFGHGFESDIAAIVSRFAGQGLAVVDDDGKQRAGMTTAQVAEMIRGGAHG